MPDMIGGERPSAPSGLRSPVLRAHGRAAADHCVRRCYETWPDLAARYGARGRQHAVRDAAWHLEHLDGSVAAGEPRLFADYADWLAGLLGARGIGREQVAGAFGFLAEALEAARCPAGREAHRGDLVAILRDNRSRLLGGGPGAATAITTGGGAGAPALGGPPPRPAGPARHLDYYARLVELDRDGAVAVVEAYLRAHGDPLGVYSDVLEPALAHTGREWQAGRISVAHEHYISEVTRDVVVRLGGSTGPTAEGAPIAVACCVPRERHTLGLMMVADALRRGGVAVHMLGEGLPGEAVLRLMAEVDAGLLCVSCTLDVHLPDAARLIRRVRRARPGVRVAVGGAALRGRGAARRARLGADFTAPDLLGVRRLLPDWLRQVTGPTDRPFAGPGA